MVRYNNNDYQLIKYLVTTTKERFYFIVDKNMTIYDYGKIVKFDNQLDKCQLLPYGGTKAYDVYGYDENGYDNKGYKTDGYNDAGYDREGYNKAGYNAAGYNRDGYKTDGYNDAGYDKDGYMRDGYNDAGYDREGYDRDGYNAKGYDRDGYDKEGYNKNGYNEAGFDRDGYDKNGRDKDGYDKKGYKPGYYNFINYLAPGDHRVDNDFDRNNRDRNGYDKNGVYKDGFIYTSNYTISYMIVPQTWENPEEKLAKGEMVRWHQDGRKVNDIAAWASTNCYNFEVAVDKKIRNYYANQSVGFETITPSKGEEYSQTRYVSGVLYITVPQSYVNRKGKKTNIYYLAVNHNGGRTSTRLYKIKSRYIRVKLAYGDSVFIGNYASLYDGSVCRHPFTYKYVPSVKSLGASTVSFKYKGKLINASETKVNIKPNKTKTDIVYTSNIDYGNLSVSSSNTKIVKAQKVKFMYSKKGYSYNIKHKWLKFDKDAKATAVKLTGGSKSGTATVTIKDKKSGKTQKITVTNK